MSEKLASYAFSAVRELARQMGGSLTRGGNLLTYHPNVGAICDWVDRIEASHVALKEALHLAAEALDAYSDVNDGQDGPTPNRAMSALQEIGAVIAKAEGKQS